MAIADIAVKVERAKEHLAQLDFAVRAFLETNPYTVGTKNDPQTRKLIYYVTEIKPVPQRIAAIAGDILQNLRSALDHLAHQLVLANRGKPTVDTCFPVFDDAAKYKAGVQRKIQGMSDAAIRAIDAIKPYEGGNDTLWKIHKLNNIDKHRLVLTVGSAFQSVDLGAHVIRRAAEINPAFAGIDLHAFFKPADRLFPLKVGDELLIDAPDAKVNEKVQFAFDIAFGEPGILEGAPLIDTLKGFAEEVDGLILDFAPLLI